MLQPSGLLLVVDERRFAVWRLFVRTKLCRLARRFTGGKSLAISALRLVHPAAMCRRTLCVTLLIRTFPLGRLPLRQRYTSNSFGVLV